MVYINWELSHAETQLVVRDPAIEHHLFLGRFQTKFLMSIWRRSRSINIQTKDVPLGYEGYNDNEWQNGPDDEQDQKYGPGWQHLDGKAAKTKQI
jgi:hypothetical protein